MKDNIHLHAIFSGKVQGVSFRVTTQMYAVDLKVLGTVQNLTDGKVELFAEAPRMVLEELLKRLENDEGPSKIEKTEKKYSSEKNSFSTFKILH
jgi:acylphosphatase